MYVEWQVRVVEEKAELDMKIGKLKLFLKSEAFDKLMSKPKKQLTKQLDLMQQYSEVLSDRIAEFELPLK